MIPLSLDPNGEREAVKPVEECGKAISEAFEDSFDRRLRQDWFDLTPQARIAMRARASAVLTRLRQLGFITLEGIQAIHAEEDANGVPRSSVLPGQNTKER